MLGALIDVVLIEGAEELSKRAGAIFSNHAIVVGRCWSERWRVPDNSLASARIHSTYYHTPHTHNHTRTLSFTLPF